MEDPFEWLVSAADNYYQSTNLFVAELNSLGVNITYHEVYSMQRQDDGKDA